MQIKTTLRFHLTPVRMIKIKKIRRQQVLERMWKKRNTPPLLLGTQAGTTLECYLTNMDKGWSSIETNSTESSQTHGS